MWAANRIDTIDYMGDWMDKVFEMELEVMFEEDEEREDEGKSVSHNP